MSAPASRHAVPSSLPAPSCGAAPAGPHPDAAMLAHLPALLFLVARATWLKAKDSRLRELADAECGPRPDWSHQEVWDWERAHEAARARLGSRDAWQRWVDVEHEIDAIRAQVVGVPARTIEGLYVKTLLTDRQEEQNDPVVLDILADLQALGAGRPA